MLAKYAVASDTRILELETDWYAVNVKHANLWDGVGNITFDSGRLTRIAVDDCQVHDQPVEKFARALYSAIASAESSGVVNVRTARNNDANHPSYKVHFVFKDREVAVTTAVYGDDEVHDIVTYFPRASGTVAK